MHTKKNKLISHLMVSTALLGVGAPLVAPAVSVFATETSARVPATVNLTIHKMQFNHGTTPTPSAQNTGNVLEVSNAEPYNKADYGDVEFTLYRLDKAQVKAALKANNQNAQAVADAFAADTSLYGGQAVQSNVEVDDQGTLTFANVASNNDDVYVIIESKAPATVVTKSKAMLIQLPITNADGTGYLNEVHLYPKNEVKKLEQTLKKLGKMIAGDASALQGVKFKLFKGEPGQGTAVRVNDADVVLTTDDQGLITATGLTKGKYYFVEQETADLVDGLTTEDTTMDAREGVGTLLAGFNALNDDKNQLTFEVTAEGTITPNDKLAAYTNYERPSVDKTVADAVDNPNFDYARKEAIPFKITKKVPDNLENYSKFQLADQVFLNGQETDDIKVLEESFVVKTQAGATLEKGVDYTVTFDHTKGAWALDFFVNRTTTEAVRNAKEIVVEYNATIDSEDFAIDQAYTNRVTLTYNNSPEGNTKDRHDKDEQEFKTFGAKILKKGDGLWGSGIAATPLAGAKFVVKNADGKFFAGFDGKTTNAEAWVDNQTDALVLTTPDTGILELKGFKEGTYTLVEIKAPTGYRLPVNNETQITVGENTFGTAVEIVNERTPELPMTGSEKLVLIGVTATMALSASAYVVIKRKRQEA